MWLLTFGGNNIGLFTSPEAMMTWVEEQKPGYEVTMAYEPPRPAQGKRPHKGECWAFSFKGQEAGYLIYATYRAYFVKIVR